MTLQSKNLGFHRSCLDVACSGNDVKVRLFSFGLNCLNASLYIIQCVHYTFRQLFLTSACCPLCFPAIAWILYVHVPTQSLLFTSASFKQVLMILNNLSAVTLLVCRKANHPTDHQHQWIWHVINKRLLLLSVASSICIVKWLSRTLSLSCSSFGMS